MSCVTVLRPVEGLGLDPVRLSALYREFGPAGAERRIARAVSEMALQISALMGFYNAAEFNDFARGLRSLRRLADYTGFAGLSRVAAAVGECAVSGDATSLAATWERLLRLAARLLSAGGNIQGLSG